MELKGAGVLVTGAASGLGAATAELLADRGAGVVGFDLAASVEKLEAPRPDIRYVGGDVTSESDVRAALDAFDDAELRLVVNCAGIARGARILGSKGPHDLELFRRVIEINLIGTFNVMRLAAERMAASEPVDADGQRGVIVNVSSVAAFEANIGQIAYSASKGGVAAMSLTAARDLARNGIRVNTIAPGVVGTPMVRGMSEAVQRELSGEALFPGRFAEPEEFARLVAMLAEHDYMNGEVVRMDAGARFRP